MLTPDIFFKISGFVSLIVNGALGVFVFLRSPKKSLNVRFALFSLCIAFWSVGSAYVNIIRNENIAIWALRQSYLFGVFVPPLFLHFVTTFVGWDKKFKVCLLIAYSVAIILVFFVFSSLFIPSYRVLPQYGGYRIDVPGPAYSAFAVFFILTIFSTLILLLIFYFKQARGNQKNQLKFIFVGYFFGTLAGLEYFLGVFGILKRPPLDDYMLILTFAFMTYAIVRHRALDIEVVIKKTLIFAGVFGMAMIVVSTVSTVMQVYVGKYWAVSSNISTLISVLLAIILYKPTRALLVAITDRFLFQKKSEIKVILRNLSERVMTLLDLKQVGQTILTTLVETFRLESGMVVVYDRGSQNYRILESIGLPSEDFVRSVRKYFGEREVNQYFADHSGFTALDHVDPDGLPAIVREWLTEAKARVCIPLSLGEGQSGFLILGKKKSDREFTKDETDYFSTISTQVSLAIQKTRLLETVVEEREAKVKAEHLAKRVEFAGMIKHEIQNKLVHIQTPANTTASYCVPRLRKWHKEQDEERFSEMCDEIVKNAKNINFAVEHISIIAQTARKGVDEKDQSFEQLDFKLIWEDAKKESSLVELCDFESSMPERFYVYCNYHALQRTFVNLIRNAYDAMKDKDAPLIKLRCSYKQIGGKQTAYFELEDSGCGIPKEIQEKVFEDGFSTKPKPDAKDLISSGHGQGLAACKLYIEGIHNGKIWFESEEWSGTTFKFWVPMKGDGGGGLG